MPCPVCGKPTKYRSRFCSRDCLRVGYKKGMVVNSGNFRRGSVSPNKGHTLESWVGPVRAAEIRAKMSVNSKKKAVHLQMLNNDKGILEKRLKSRKVHDDVVLWIASALRAKGKRVFVLSEYVRERRIPDAIIWDGKRLTALEVETEKRWKPSHESTQLRLSQLNSLCGFFDNTAVVFPDITTPVEEMGPSFVAHVEDEERLNPMA